MSAFRKIIMTLGVLLIAAGALITVFSVGKEKMTVADREETLAFLKERLPSEKKGYKEERSTFAMPLLSCEGVDYAALFSYPRFSVELPVAAVWNTDLVPQVPCRFTGSPYDGTLVIGGTFDFIDSVDIGDEITVTDLQGYVFTYRVTSVLHSKSASASRLTDGNADLTFFSRSAKGREYLLVRCSMI